jgi:hypothetical protein
LAAIAPIIAPPRRRSTDDFISQFERLNLVMLRKQL